MSSNADEITGFKITIDEQNIDPLGSISPKKVTLEDVSKSLLETKTKYIKPRYFLNFEKSSEEINSTARLHVENEGKNS